jgi:hypothetical protein
MSDGQGGSHGLRTSDKPCPQCGDTGHEVAVVLGVRAILCPNIPLGEIHDAKKVKRRSCKLCSNAGAETCLCGGLA